MDDEQAVRVRDGVAHVEREAEPVDEPEAAAPGVGRERLAVHALHDEVGPPAVRDAPVEEPGDPGVVEPREHAALALEPADGLAGGPPSLHHLERDRPVVDAVGPLGGVDDAHPAAAQLPDDAVAADRLGRRRVLEQALDAHVEERVGLLVEREEGLDGGAEVGVARAGPVEERRAVRVGDLVHLAGQRERAPLQEDLVGRAVGHEGRAECEYRAAAAAKQPRTATGRAARSAQTSLSSRSPRMSLPVPALRGRGHQSPRAPRRPPPRGRAGEPGARAVGARALVGALAVDQHAAQDLAGRGLRDGVHERHGPDLFVRR